MGNGAMAKDPKLPRPSSTLPQQTSDVDTTLGVQSEFDRKLSRDSPSGGRSSLSLQRRFMKFPWMSNIDQQSNLALQHDD